MSVIEAFGGDRAPNGEVLSPEPNGQVFSPEPVYQALDPATAIVASDNSFHETTAGTETLATTSGDGQAPTALPRDDAPRGRLRSYVIPAGDQAASDLDGSVTTQTDSAVDRAGVDHVLSFERDSERDPVEKPHEFPGYDIESIGPDGFVERYIEVKSLAGPWDSYGVSVSRRQFTEAQNRGETYWLYVVARAQRSDFIIYCIQNPAAKVDQFMFDDGWIEVGETSVAGKPNTAAPLANAAARRPDRT